MSTADLVPTPEGHSVVSPDSNGGPVNGDPTELREQLQREPGSPADAPPADRTAELLEEFAAAVAHELRTPLAIIELAADTVLERTDQLEPEQLAEVLRVIRRHTQLATLMLGRLGLARDVGTDPEHLEREMVDLSEIARQTSSDLADVLLAAHPTEVHAPVAVMAYADPTAVREILTNLLSNAAKYSPQGSSIDVTVEQDEEQGEAMATVRDRGRGLTAADAERVFGKYQRAAADASGVGLGLYVSRGLARAHGGDLVVRPTTPRGSEFRLTLPNAGPPDGRVTLV